MAAQPKGCRLSGQTLRLFAEPLEEEEDAARLVAQSPQGDNPIRLGASGGGKGGPFLHRRSFERLFDAHHPFSVSETSILTNPYIAQFPERFAGLFIPRSIFEQDLPLTQKVLLAEVRALAELQKEKGCFASNAHLSALIGVNERSVRKHITALENAGHLRAEGRDGKKRRMWMNERPHDNGSQTEPGTFDQTRQDEADLPSDVGQKVPAARQADASDPGTPGTNAASGDRPTRRQTATETTIRKQGENTKENTKGFGFELPNWMPTSVWEKWIAFNLEAGRKLGNAQMAAQISTLEKLDTDGYPFRDVIDQSIANGWKSFHQLPKKPNSYTTRFGTQIFGGMVVRR